MLVLYITMVTTDWDAFCLFICNSSWLSAILCFSVSPPTCSKDEFLCDGRCEFDFVKCDGESDCKDGADELGCGELLNRKLVVIKLYIVITYKSNFPTI
jgi:hypothetical protein